jgi:hypothetical protein
MLCVTCCFRHPLLCGIEGLCVGVCVSLDVTRRMQTSNVFEVHGLRVLLSCRGCSSILSSASLAFLYDCRLRLYSVHPLFSFGRLCCLFAGWVAKRTVGSLSLALSIIVGSQVLLGWGLLGIWMGMASFFASNSVLDTLRILSPGSPFAGTPAHVEHERPRDR